MILAASGFAELSANKAFFQESLAILRVYIYIYTRPKKHLKNERRSRDAAANKRANTSGVGKINNYCEDIYVPPYNNTYTW